MGLLEVIWPLQVGNALLGGIFQVLFDRLVPHGSPSVREHEVHSELSTWFTTLAMIEEDLGDAEEKQWSSTAVKMWLDNLRDFAYDLEDMLEEHNTEILRRSLEEKSQTIDISNIIEGLKSGGMTQRWKELCVQRSQLGLVEKTSTAVWQRPSSTCLPTEPAICGRDEDKAKLLEMVLRDEPSESNFRVISIVGMAGVGKTTLAKQVYVRVCNSPQEADTQRKASVQQHSSAYSGLAVYKPFDDRSNVNYPDHQGCWRSFSH